jgi:hypothetical protein
MNLVSLRSIIKPFVRGLSLLRLPGILNHNFQGFFMLDGFQDFRVLVILLQDEILDLFVAVVLSWPRLLYFF